MAKYFIYSNMPVSGKYTEVSEKEFKDTVIDVEGRYYISFGNTILECSESEYKDYASKSIRFERMLKRKEEKDERTAFLLEEAMYKENSMFDYDKLMLVADMTYNFNISLNDYLSNERTIISKLYDELLYRKIDNKSKIIL